MQTIYSSGAVAQWLTGSLAHWLTGSLVHWLTGSLGRWLIGSLAHWLTGSLARWLTGSLAHWLTGSLAHWLTGSLARASDSRLRDPGVESCAAVSNIGQLVTVCLDATSPFRIQIVLRHCLQCYLRCDWLLKVRLGRRERRRIEECTRPTSTRAK